MFGFAKNCERKHSHVLNHVKMFSDSLPKSSFESIIETFIEEYFDWTNKGVSSTAKCRFLCTGFNAWSNVSPRHQEVLIATYRYYAFFTLFWKTDFLVLRWRTRNVFFFTCSMHMINSQASSIQSLSAEDFWSMIKMVRYLNRSTMKYLKYTLFIAYWALIV